MCYAEFMAAVTLNFLFSFVSHVAINCFRAISMSSPTCTSCTSWANLPVVFRHDILIYNIYVICIPSQSFIKKNLQRDIKLYVPYRQMTAKTLSDLSVIFYMMYNIILPLIQFLIVRPNNRYICKVRISFNTFHLAHSWQAHTFVYHTTWYRLFRNHFLMKFGWLHMPGRHINGLVIVR